MSGFVQSLKSWDKRKPRLCRLIVKTLIFLGLFTYYAATLPDIGLTDDDDFYVPAGKKYVAWLGDTLSGVVKGDFSGFKKQKAGATWNCRHGCNREHPPFAKMVIGLSHAVFHKAFGEINGARIGIALLAAWLVYLVFSLTWRIFGLRAAAFAALALMFMPRFFIHGHVPTLDLPVAFTYFLTAYCFWRGLTSLWWGFLTGVAFGLALLTKLNAPFAILPMGLFWLWHIKRGFRIQGGNLRFGPVPINILAMMIIGPMMFFLLWPRMWHDTFNNLSDYVNFHLRHYPIYFYYLDKIHVKPFAPWHAPFVMTAATVPLTILFFSICGMVAGFWRFIAPWFNFDTPTPPPEKSPRRGFILFLLLNAFTCIGIVAFLGAPKYGGVKLFLPLFPFLAIFAGYGFDRSLALLLRRIGIEGRKAVALVMVTLTLTLLPAMIQLIRIHPYHLSYYNELIGGLEGATETGMERQYYDVAYIELARWLKKEFGNRPEGTQVTFLPNNKEYFRTFPYLHRDGILPRSIRIGGLRGSQYLILTHERRWAQYPQMYRRHAARKEPLFEIYRERVPLLSVYKL